ncbi:hypothetical protein LTR36_006447 [Oleoguttula mirabilis]|uniref:LemA family protein n=1 Tax=Oleoguttula mirabilis TaxID=1507867 RepID=A0AAV9JUP9_9PEZI|nr:hypothetical protein LTR36_006447 [Oleoguttula mirabilis]
MKLTVILLGVLALLVAWWWILESAIGHYNATLAEADELVRNSMRTRLAQGASFRSTLPIYESVAMVAETNGGNDDCLEATLLAQSLMKETINIVQLQSIETVKYFSARNSTLPLAKDKDPKEGKTYMTLRRLVDLKDAFVTLLPKIVEAAQDQEKKCEVLNAAAEQECAARGLVSTTQYKIVANSFDGGAMGHSTGNERMGPNETEQWL